MSKIKFYRDKVEILFELKYEIVKIRSGNILKFLSDYLLNFVECTRIALFMR